MSRVKFCPRCDEVLAWDVKTCKGCGASQPADPDTLAQTKQKKALELERLRLAAHVERRRGDSSAPAEPTPTRKALGWAIFFFLLAVVGVAFGTYQKKPTFVLIGWVAAAACNVAVFWLIIHSAVASAIRTTRDD